MVWENKGTLACAVGFGYLEKGPCDADEDSIWCCSVDTMERGSFDGVGAGIDCMWFYEMEWEEVAIMAFLWATCGLLSDGIVCRRAGGCVVAVMEFLTC